MRTGTIMYLATYADGDLNFGSVFTEAIVLGRTFFRRKKLFKGSVRTHRKDLKVGEEVYFKLTPYIKNNYIVKKEPRRV